MTPSKNHTAIGLVAAAVVFLAFPLAVAILFLANGGPEGIAEGFMEAGAFAYAIVAATFLTCIASAVALFLSARRGFSPALAALPVVLLSIIAMVGMGIGRAQVLDALVMVSPADRLTILAAGIGETINLQIIALAFTAASLVMVALGALIMLGTGQRGPALFSAGGALALAAMSALFCRYWSTVESGFKAVANAEPTQRARLLTMIIDGATSSHRAGLMLLGVTVVIALAAIAVLMKNERVHALGTGIALLVTGIGVAGMHSRVKHEAFSIPNSALLFPEANRTVDGSPRFEQGPLVAGEDEIDDQPETVDTLGLLVTDDTKADDLRATMRSAKKKRARVQLVVPRRRDPALAATEKDCDFCRAFGSTLTGVPLTVKVPGEKCPSCVPMGPTWARSMPPRRSVVGQGRRRVRLAHRHRRGPARSGRAGVAQRPRAERGGAFR